MFKLALVTSAVTGVAAFGAAGKPTKAGNAVPALPAWEAKWDPTDDADWKMKELKEEDTKGWTSKQYEEHYTKLGEAYEAKYAAEEKKWAEQGQAYADHWNEEGEKYAKQWGGQRRLLQAATKPAMPNDSSDWQVWEKYEVAIEEYYNTKYQVEAKKWLDQSKEITDKWAKVGTEWSDKGDAEAKKWAAEAETWSKKYADMGATWAKSYGSLTATEAGSGSCKPEHMDVVMEALKETCMKSKDTDTCETPLETALAKDPEKVASACAGCVSGSAGTMKDFTEAGVAAKLKKDCGFA